VRDKHFKFHKVALVKLLRDVC